MNLVCPIPDLDFDIITLGHGSGGILTQQLLDKGVFQILKNSYLDEAHDGAQLVLPGTSAFSTDSFVVSPIFFPGGDIGELAVNGTVNDLAMCGAVPKYLSLSFIIEEGLDIASFWKILYSIRAACDAAGVHIVTGDTKVVEKGKGDQIFINTSGIGTVHPKANIHLNRVAVGDQIVVSGPLAAHGVAIMSRREGLEFETDIVSDTQPLHHMVRLLLDRFGEDIHLLRDPTRGGLATVMAEIAGTTRLGIDLRQENIPIPDEVESACEILGLDPLYVANEGVFVGIVKGDIAESFTEALREMEGGQQAACIGTVVDAHPKQVILESSIGGRRVVSRLPGEQLPRIC